MDTRGGGGVIFAHTSFVSMAETMEGIDLGETTHKKPGTTVPESIHSFSKSTLRRDPKKDECRIFDLRTITVILSVYS